MWTVADVAECASGLVTACLLGRLIALGLQRQYLALMAWLGVDLVEQVLRILFLRVVHVRSYASWTYALGELIQALLTIFIVREVWTSMTVGYAALAKVGRWTVVLVFALTVGVAVWPVVAVLGEWTLSRDKLQALLATHSAADNVAAIFFALVAGAAAWFPIVVLRNVVVYVQGMTTFFLGEWVLLWLVRELPQERAVLNLALWVLPLACRTYWLFAFRSSESEEAGPMLGFHTPERSRELALRVHRANAFVDQLSRRV